MNEQIPDSAVVILKLESTSNPSSEDMARSAYEFLKALSPPLKDRVVMKPNITVPAEPDSGIITHPDFISGMIDYFCSIGISRRDIIVAEGISGGDPDGEDGYFGKSGYAEMALRQGIKLVNLNLDEIVPFRLPKAEILKTIGIAKTVCCKDSYFINVPKYKTHNLAVTTLSMKNLMGTIVPISSRHLCSAGKQVSGQDEITPNGITLREELLCRKLCDLSLAVRPDLNIIEGIVGRDGTAFHHGKNIRTNLVIGGKIAVSVDAVASYLMGFDPTRIGYLNIANQRGLGIIDVHKVKVYEVRDGELIPCDDVSKFMSPIPFEVLAWDKHARDIPLNEEMLARLNRSA